MKPDELEPTQEQAARIVAEAGRLPTSQVGPHLGTEELRQLVEPGVDERVEAALMAHVDSCPMCANAAIEAFRARELSTPKAAGGDVSADRIVAAVVAEDGVDDVAADDWDAPDPHVRELAALLVSVGQWPAQTGPSVPTRGRLLTRRAGTTPSPPHEPSRLDRALLELKDADDRVRRAVAAALGDPVSRGSLAALRYLALHDPEPSVRSKAVDALARNGGAAAIAALRDAAADAIEGVRADIVDALGAMLVTAADGSETTAIRECLRRIADTDASSRVRERAAQLF